MAAPTVSLPVSGTAPDQFATKQGLEGAFNAALETLHDDIQTRASGSDLTAENARAVAAEAALSDRVGAADDRAQIANPMPRGGIIPGMAWAVTDRAGRRVGFGLDGLLEAGGSRHFPDRNRGAAGRVIDGFLDRLGRVALGVTAAGSVLIGDLISAARGGRGAVGPWLPVITTLSGRVLIGARHGWLQPMAVGVGTWRDPAEIAGAWAVSNVRLGPEHLYATLHDGAYSGDVMQRPGSATVVPVEARPAQGILVIGQSNAGAGSGPSGPLPLPYSHRGHALMTGWYGAYGSSDATSSIAGYADLLPIAGPSGDAYAPGLALTEALAALDMQQGRRSPGYVSFTSWEGSQPLENFFPGTAGHWLHENAVAGAAAMRSCAAKYRGADLAAVLLIQGEAGAGSSGDYPATLADWLDDVAPLYGAGRVLLRQTNIPSTATGPSSEAVPQAQLAAARARIAAGVTLTGPMYHLPLHDTIHVGNLGRLIGAEMDAVALHGGAGWHPLWPVAGGVTRAGAVITIPMSLPPGAKRLALDDDWVAAIPDRGLVYSDSGSGVTIASVTVSGSNVVVTLSADPGSASGKALRYALDPTSNVAGWAGGRGQIYAETDTPSPAALRGAAIPPTIRHYCVAFEETFA